MMWCSEDGQKRMEHPGHGVQLRPHHTDSSDTVRNTVLPCTCTTLTVNLPLVQLQREGLRIFLETPHRTKYRR